MTPRPEDFRAGPLRLSPWFTQQMPVAERAAIVARIPDGHWIVGTASRSGLDANTRTYQAVLAGPMGEVRRAKSGIPFLACLRALGVEA